MILEIGRIIVLHKINVGLDLFILPIPPGMKNNKIIIIIIIGIIAQ